MESFGLITYICSSIKRPVGLDFAKHVSHKLHTIVDINLNQQILYICLDKLNFHFNRTLTVNNNIKCKPNLILKLRFSHKIIEYLDIEHFINSKKFLNLYPCKSSFLPTVIYTNTPPIYSQIFNYKKFLKILTRNNIATFNSNEKPPCDYISSEYKNFDTGHIVTGDLTINKNTKLQ